MDLLDAVSYHQLVLAAEGRTAKTQKQYRHFESVFLRYLAAQRLPATLEQLTADNVRGALTWYMALPVQQRTRNGEIGGQAFVDTMKLFANFLENEGIIGASPLLKLKRVKVAKRLRRPFTHAEVVALWGAAKLSPTPIRDEALFLLLLDTGMRIGEACTLRLADVQLDQRMVIISENGKGRRERVVPIGQPNKRDGGRTIRALRAYIERRPERGRDGGRVFLGRDGFPLEAAGGSQIIQRLGQVAKVSDAGPHRLRHSFATWWLVTYPGDEIGLRRIIGQVSKETLADYIHFSQSVLHERSGNASLAETLAMPTVERSLPGHPRRLEAPLTPAPPDANAIVEAVRNDPELRKALLRALLEGEAA